MATFQDSVHRDDMMLGSLRILFRAKKMNPLRFGRSVSAVSKTAKNTTSSFDEDDTIESDEDEDTVPEEDDSMDCVVDTGTAVNADDASTITSDDDTEQSSELVSSCLDLRSHSSSDESSAAGQQQSPSFDHSFRLVKEVHQLLEALMSKGDLLTHLDLYLTECADAGAALDRLMILLSGNRAPNLRHIYVRFVNGRQPGDTIARFCHALHSHHRCRSFGLACARPLHPQCLNAWVEGLVVGGDSLYRLHIDLPISPAGQDVAFAFALCTRGGPAEFCSRFFSPEALALLSTHDTRVRVLAGAVGPDSLPGLSGFAGNPWLRCLSLFSTSGEEYDGGRVESDLVTAALCSLVAEPNLAARNLEDLSIRSFGLNVTSVLEAALARNAVIASGTVLAPLTRVVFDGNIARGCGRGLAVLMCGGSLEHLSVAQCNLSDTDILDILHALTERSCHAESLDLSRNWNQTTDQSAGLLALVKALETNRQLRLLRVPPMDSYLPAFAVRVRSSLWTRLGAAIAIHPSLRTLDLGGVLVAESTGVDQFCDLVLRAPQLRVLTLPKSLRDHPAVCQLLVPSSSQLVVLLPQEQRTNEALFARNRLRELHRMRTARASALAFMMAHRRARRSADASMQLHWMADFVALRIAKMVWNSWL